MSLDKLSEKIEGWYVATELDPAIVKALIGVVRAADEMRIDASNRDLTSREYDLARARLEEVLKEF